MKPISILHVIDSLGVGGAEHQLLELIVRSDRSKFEHRVAALTTAEWFGEDLRAAGVEVHTLGLGGGFEFRRGIRRLRDVLERLRPDLLHASLSRAGIIARAAGRLAQTPVITTLVNTTYEPEWSVDNPRLTRAKLAFVQAVDRLTATRWGMSFIAISETVKTSAMRRLAIPADRIVVIPRGFPFDEAVAPQPGEVAEARRRIAGESYPVVLAVGRLVPQKAHRYLIDAMVRIRQTYPHARLLIVGEGWLREDLEAQIRRLGLGDSVQLLGKRRDVALLLAASDIFAFPSLFEGFGVSLLEAMAAGRPIVASDLPVLREVTAGHAALVPSRDPAALASAIVRIAQDQQLAASLAAAAARRARDFDIRTSVGALEQLYESVLAGTAQRGSVRSRETTAGMVPEGGEGSV